MHLMQDAARINPAQMSKKMSDVCDVDVMQKISLINDPRNE